MKKMLFIVLLPLLAITSCSKVQEHSMTVIRDCTGTYLRINDKDYEVCNTAVANDYPSGTQVRVSFKAIGSCKEAPEFECELYHPSEGWIKIVHIEEE